MDVSGHSLVLLLCMMTQVFEVMGAKLAERAETLEPRQLASAARVYARSGVKSPEVFRALGRQVRAQQTSNNS